MRKFFAFILCIFFVSNTSFAQDLFHWHFPESFPIEAQSYLKNITSKSLQQVEVFFEEGGTKDLEGYQVSTLAEGDQKLKVTIRSLKGRGAVFGAFEALENLGYGFYHPLKPLLPTTAVTKFEAQFERAAPHWKDRGIHLNTNHPLELTAFLNGFGDALAEDQTSWEKHLEKWRSYCAWAVASRLNRIEWALLHSESYKKFSQSEERIRRLEKIVSVAHGFGLLVGIELPLSLTQENAFSLIRKSEATPPQDQIKARLEWIMQVRFDFISTVINEDEVELLNVASEFLDSKFQVSLHTKLLGSPENFNRQAQARVGVIPYTQQFYGLKDPSPFAETEKFMFSQIGKHKIWWSPETSSWNSFDVDVPLFLPLYAYKRVQDLNEISKKETVKKFIDGQLFSSSGPEWGHWFNDLMAARASYSPGNFHTLIKETFSGKLKEQNLERFASALLKIAEGQEQVLIWGENADRNPTKVTKRNGQAYLEGFEAMDELGAILDQLPKKVKGPQIPHQPARLDPVQLAQGNAPGDVDYREEVAPLLWAMEAFLEESVQEFSQLEKEQAFLQEMEDALKITKLRASFMLELYEYAGSIKLYLPHLGAQIVNYKDGLTKAKKILEEAQKIVKLRESSYVTAPAVVASWGKNPTAYPFNYLWTVHELYYWKRDLKKVKTFDSNPCLMNIIDPVNLGLGEDYVKMKKLTYGKLRKVAGLHSFSQCMKAQEY